MKAQERKKLQEAKKRAKEKAEEMKAKKKIYGDVGEFGFRVNTLNHKFCLAISRKALKMAEVKKLAFNEKKQTFYEPFKLLKKNKLANKTKDGKMYIIGSKADPKKKK